MARDFSKAFYNSKEWKVTREVILKRDFYLCRKCGRPAEEVHHIVHLSPLNIGDVSITMNPDNLISLCKDCHFAQHEEDKKNGQKKHRHASYDERVYEFDENGFLVQKQKDEIPPVK